MAGRGVSGAGERVGVRGLEAPLGASTEPAPGGGPQRVRCRPGLPQVPRLLVGSPRGTSCRLGAVARASADPGMLCTWRSAGPRSAPRSAPTARLEMGPARLRPAAGLGRYTAVLPLPTVFLVSARGWAPGSCSQRATSLVGRH